MAELAPGLKVEVYTINKNGKETLIGDSSAEKGTETRDNIDAMFSGEYKAKKDTMLYIKITRDDTVSKNEELAYVLQIHVLGLGVLNQNAQAGVARRVGTSGLDGDLDLFAQLGEGAGHVTPAFHFSRFAILKGSSHKIIVFFRIFSFVVQRYKIRS